MCYTPRPNSSISTLGFTRSTHSLYQPSPSRRASSPPTPSADITNTRRLKKSANPRRVCLSRLGPQSGPRVIRRHSGPFSYVFFISFCFASICSPFHTFLFYLTIGHRRTRPRFPCARHRISHNDSVTFQHFGTPLHIVYIAMRSCRRQTSHSLSLSFLLYPSNS